MDSLRDSGMDSGDRVGKPRKIIADAYAVYIWVSEAGADRGGVRIPR